MSAPKSNGRNSRKVAPAKNLTITGLNSTQPTYFLGTENPRQLRAIHTLLRRPVPREHLDSIVGCSNGPELVAELRRRGLDVPCERISFIDRDDKPCRPGVYSLTLRDRRMIYAWLAKQAKG
ncbi:hypothetical protein [Rhodoferax sp. UBA5149]|uniref:hypothetical protein n=1 Tax=Rhodoferax sp. UBA5149 TaxID=1947379 RepID=UPI0025F6931A|nr:hypothetical protein [Rhodoferax sp. UBA5149]